MKHKLKNKIARRNINNLRYADDNTLMAESEEELKSLLMKVKEKGGAKMAKEQDGETNFSPTNSLKEQLNAEQTPQNNF